MIRTILLALLCSLFALQTSAQPQTRPSATAVRVEVERLPDLNIPRASHTLFSVNGELTVVGGHTDGFVPTPTAEYLKDGEWHVMQMVYNHDFGTSVVLKNGKVLLLGGSEQPIGIGQTFLAEFYDPKTHTFNGFGSMERKRAGASALEMDNGQVVISGNWYHDDGIEVFDGKKRFTYIKDVAVQRSMPHIFQTAKHDAIIVGSNDNKGDSLFSDVVDCLKGDTIHVPLFKKWHPLPVVPPHDADCMIGDASKGQYTYLMAVQDSTGQVAIAKVENGAFSLLPTDGAIPMWSQWGRIEYCMPIVVDRQQGLAYMTGAEDGSRSKPDKPRRFYVLCIDYAHASEERGAPLTLYYTDLLLEAFDCPPVLTAEGDLIFAGGIPQLENFAPSKSVWLFHLGSKASVASNQGTSLWLWLLAAIVLISLLLGFILLTRRRPVPVIRDSANDELMDRIRQLMEQQQLYLNSDLRLEDIASALGLNRSYVSDCINSHTGDSFSQFVNGYRIEYAKRVLHSQPDTKVASLYMAAGFSSEQSFYRNFKSFTGMTPKEWIASHKD